MSIILYVAAGAVACGSGGTGRRARLRGVWISPYGFKSRFPHQSKAVAKAAALFLKISNDPDQALLYIET